MSLIKRLREDKMTAFKNKDQFRKDLLATLIAESCKQDKEPSDSAVIATIKKFINNIDFNLAVPNITDDQERHWKHELVVLQSYIPQQMSEDDVRRIISIALEEGLDTVASIMGYFKDSHDGLYDGKMVSRIVKEILE